jgi:GAF domain-containing protein
MDGVLLPSTAGGRSGAWQAGGAEPSYRFAHDRVLEAALGLMSWAERAALSLDVARRLAASAGGKELAHKVAACFNVARALVDSEPERLACAELNLHAGMLAKGKAAFSQALYHFLAGIEFLHLNEPCDAKLDAAWRQQHALCRALHEHGAEAALCNGDLQRAHDLCAEVLRCSAEPLQKIHAYEVRIRTFNAEKRFPEAVAAACEVLRELGVTFPDRPTTFHAIVGYLTTKRRLFSQPIERLMELPGNRDEPVKAESRIMQAMYSSAYLGHRHLFPLLVYRHVSHSLVYGSESYSSVTYTGFAIVLCAMGKFDLALRLGEVSLELLKRAASDEHKARTFMGYYVFLFPWRNHLRNAVPYYEEAISAGLSHGDFEYAGHLLTLHSLARLHVGDALPALRVEFEQHRIKITSLRQERSIILQQLLCQLLQDLCDDTRVGPVLRGPLYDEPSMLPRCLEPLDHNLAFHHYFAKLIACSLLGQHDAALEAAREGRLYFDGGAFGIYLGAVFAFWESLAWLATSEPRVGLRGAIPARVRRNQVQLKRWAASAPMNFLHKYELLEAECWRRRRRDDRAALHYEKAIELSQAHGYLHETALAQERAASFYLERGMQRLGRHYLRECYATYRRWGASAVTRRLERLYPQHFSVLLTAAEPGSSPWLGPSQQQDFRVLLGASQAISAETQLPRLLERLLHSMFQHAGAQRAVLVLERQGQLYVEAEADVERGKVRFPAEEQMELSEKLCASIVHYVARTGKALALGDARDDHRFSRDPYVQQRQPKSVLCTPLMYQGQLLGVAYLENNRVSHVFTDARQEIAGLLAAQAATSIASARFHALQMEAHQAKINPHFLFNALSSIAELAVADGAVAEHAIIRLSHLYRYILETSNQALVTLGQELLIVKDYLALEKLRLGSKLEFSVESDAALERVLIPGLLIQPLVENAIRHGVAPKLEGGKIWVEAVQVGDECRVVVQDDGDGQKRQSSGTGFGLRSVQERLALVYGNGYSMAISRPAGYRVEICVPVSLPRVSSRPPESLPDSGPRLIPGFSPLVRSNDRSV